MTRPPTRSDTDEDDRGDVLSACLRCPGEGGQGTCAECAESQSEDARRCSDCTVQRACAGCDEPADARDGGDCTCQRSASAGGRIFRACRGGCPGKWAVGRGTADRINAMRRGGGPLPGSVQRFMEPRLDADLSGVRVHTGAAEADAAGRLDARAFTVGSDIFFGRGEFQPGTAGGMRLLAHELAHTVQQPPKPAAAGGVTVSDPGDDLEVEAERVAGDVVAGRAATMRARSAGSAATVRNGVVAARFPLSGPAQPRIGWPPPAAPSEAVEAAYRPAVDAGLAMLGRTRDAQAAALGPAGIIDDTCAAMRARGLLPTQQGVYWKGHPAPAVLTPCNTHRDAPYVENPMIPSGARCRGVCGPDCAANCEPRPDLTRCAESLGGGSHFICDYKGVQSCGTHRGCRNHDACYDWCSERGHDSILDGCHRWCDLGCICDYDMSTCFGWARGRGPFDGRMTFYDETVSVMHGPFEGACPSAAVMKARVQQYLGGGPLEVLSALAEAPLSERRHLAADPSSRDRLLAAVGWLLRPIAERVLAGAQSRAVPSLDEATWFLAFRAISAQRYGRALRIVVGAMLDRRILEPRLANWSYVPRDDLGEARARLVWDADPVTRERRARKPVEVEVYTPSFADVGWLFSSLMHEYVHVLHGLSGAPAAEFKPDGKWRPEFLARSEVEAYLWEIEHAVGSGLSRSVPHMRDLGERLSRKFDLLTPELRTQYRDRYNAAQARVRGVLAGRPPMDIDEARRAVQESSREIADLVRQRPGREAAIDAQIEAVRRRRAEALVTVALADNPAVHVVRPGEPGTYRVPTVDAEGRVRFVHAGAHVAWHVAAVSPSAFTLGEALAVGGEMSVAGTAIQGRVHPFPPDVDFDEHIHVVADTLPEAGRLAAERIITGIRRIGGGRIPGRSDIEFRHLLAFRKGGPTRRKGSPFEKSKTFGMPLRAVLAGDAVRRLGEAIAELNGGNLNTFWRGFLADGRFTDVTRVVFVSAERRNKTPLIAPGGSGDLNLAYLEDPGTIRPTSLGRFAWEMCNDALRRAAQNNWLKAAKRAYNFFSTVGDLARMAALEPVFSRPEAEVEQYATVIDSVAGVLMNIDMRLRQPRTRILTVEEARRQLFAAATKVRTRLPDSGVSPDPATLADKIEEYARGIRARNRRGHVKLNHRLGKKIEKTGIQVRQHIDLGVREQVAPIINGAIKSICPPRNV